MTVYAYDVEVFRNLFTATFVNVADKSEAHAFYTGIDKLDRTDLLKFLKSKITLVGYNNHMYDDPVLRFAMFYKGEDFNGELYKLSSKLVDDNYRSDRALLKLRYPRDVYIPWDSIDLMKLMAFDKLGISLKQISINLKWHMIMDMPIDHMKKVDAKDLPLVLKYNKNDVLITDRLYEVLEPERKLREELSKLYHVDLRSASDSKMANLILEHIYVDELKTDIREIREKRTFRDTIFLSDCVASFVEFKSPYLNEVLNRLKSKKVERYNKFSYKDTVYYANCKFTLGIGGLHSEDEAGIFETDSEYIIQDMDVASYYPNLIINNKFYPEHLGEDFITVLKRITNERLKAKASGDKVKADGLKITINSIFGKLGLEQFWLLDPKQLLSTTVSGQLGLLMLIEDLHEKGIHVISANTDGVVCKIPRKLESVYYDVAKGWEEKTRLSLEYTEYKKYIRRDVNNYITQKRDGSTKEKGTFFKGITLKNAFKMPIVAKALNNYFFENIPVKETLLSSKDIFDFCISQKTGSNFVLEHHTREGIEKLQKTNRYFISKKGGLLIKRDIHSNRTTSLNVGKMAVVLNNYNPSTPFEDYEIDYVFYEKEVMKLIDAIEPKQIPLFDLGSVEASTMTKVEVAYEKEEVKDLSVQEINKLGKNQLIKKIESIVENGGKITGISPRYIYITNFDAGTMTADMYSLGKGVRASVVVDKKAYKELRIEQGQLVFCSKFNKTQSGHVLAEYKITDKIEEERQTLL